MKTCLLPSDVITEARDVSFNTPRVRIGDVVFESDGELDGEAELAVEDLSELDFFSPMPSPTPNAITTITVNVAMIETITSHLERKRMACDGRLSLSSPASFFATSGKNCS